MYENHLYFFPFSYLRKLRQPSHIPKNVLKIQLSESTVSPNMWIVIKSIKPPIWNTLSVKKKSAESD